MFAPKLFTEWSIKCGSNDKGKHRCRHHHVSNNVGFYLKLFRKYVKGRYIGSTWYGAQNRVTWDQEYQKHSISPWPVPRILTLVFMRPGDQVCCVVLFATDIGLAIDFAFTLVFKVGIPVRALGRETFGMWTVCTFFVGWDCFYILLCVAHGWSIFPAVSSFIALCGCSLQIATQWSCTGRCVLASPCPVFNNS